MDDFERKYLQKARDTVRGYLQEKWIGFNPEMFHALVVENALIQALLSFSDSANLHSERCNKFQRVFVWKF